MFRIKDGQLKRWGWLALWLCVRASLAETQEKALTEFNPQVTDSSRTPNDALAYDRPGVLTATIYPLGSALDRPLFKFKRTSSHSGNAVRVIREFSSPDGKPAVVERVIYRDNELVHCELDELQTGAKGSADVQRDPNNPAKSKIVFRYAKNPSANIPAMRTESLAPDTLVNDMVGSFLAAHWEQLDHGDKVACRCVVLSRRETVGFIVKKESQTQWHGRDVLILKMEPSSLLISALVNPLHFAIEKNAPHHVLQYSGRTTPKSGSPGHWTDLEAITVFDW